MECNAVVTTSASRLIISAATEVRASTQRWLAVMVIEGLHRNAVAGTTGTATPIHRLRADGNHCACGEHADKQVPARRRIGRNVTAGVPGPGPSRDPTRAARSRKRIGIPPADRVNAELSAAASWVAEQTRQILCRY